MKTNKISSFFVAVALVALSLSSCSVEYRRRHPHRVYMGSTSPVNNDLSAATVAAATSQQVHETNHVSAK